MIKRISLLVTAALMAAMMMVATAAPAFAGTDREKVNGGITASCQGQCGADDKEATLTNGGGHDVSHSSGLQKKSDQIKPGNNN